MGLHLATNASRYSAVCSRPCGFPILKLCRWCNDKKIHLSWQERSTTYTTVFRDEPPTREPIDRLQEDRKRTEPPATAKRTHQRHMVQTIDRVTAPV